MKAIIKKNNIMGQYYKPVNTESMEWMYSHDYDNGLKLMEHSYLDNGFVGTVESLLIKGGKWHMKPIVWAGDYADKEPETESTENPDGINLYAMCEDENKLKPAEKTLSEQYRYLVNHDKKQYVDKKKDLQKEYDRIVNDTEKWRDRLKEWREIKKMDMKEFFTEKVWFVHPLPLLTCEGNGRGGGDYYDEEDILIGSWSRDRISVEKEIPEGFEKIEFNIVEMW